MLLVRVLIRETKEARNETHGGRRRGNDGRRRRVSGVDSSQNSSVESTGHGLDVEHGGEGFVRVLRVGLVLEGEGSESDKVVRV